MKFGKWVGGGLGWAMGGPIGAIIGFALGAVFDHGTISVQTTTTRAGGQIDPSLDSRPGDFTAALLVLAAAVMKSDGKVMKTELEYVRRFFVRNFGESHTHDRMLLLRDILRQDIPLADVCYQIRNHMPYESRLQLLHFLFGIGQSDGAVQDTEVSIIANIAEYMNIEPADFRSIKAMFYRDVNSDYLILEVAPTATDEEVKKAYRRMAVKYHPDKVASEGPEVQRAAKEKFQKLQEAYDNIKKQRGMV
jgi:DnaJ like chaperone protein